MAGAPTARPPTAAAATASAPTFPSPESAGRRLPAIAAYPVNPNCQPDRYYLLNNYNPGYFGDGTNAYALIGNPSRQLTVFTVPPSRVKTSATCC